MTKDAAFHNWLELTDADRKSYQLGHNAGVKHQNQLNKRQPLTDFEIVEALMPVNVLGEGYYLRIARAIEAAHGIGKKT